MTLKKLISLTTLLFCFETKAGQIRSIQMNSEKMQTVNLKMGQSSVLRFSDKPKKVVLGNQNYYSVEFIENDVTIQPLGSIKTNLFVYTENHVYGFILNPQSAGYYDDIVNIRWASSGFIFNEGPKVNPIKEKKIDLKIKLKSIEVVLEKVVINDLRKSHIIDFVVTNNTSKKIKSKDLDFFLTRSNEKLRVQESALEKSILNSFEKVKGRLLVKLENKQGFSFNVKHLNDIRLVIVSGWYL